MMTKILPLLVLTFLFLGCTAPATDTGNPNVPTGANGQTPNNGGTNPILPPPSLTVSIIPDIPFAGDTIRFTASTSDPSRVDRMEIWARQNGNWVTTTCYEDPCEAKWEQVEVGSFNYYAKAFLTDGTEVYDPERDYYVLNITSTVQTNDTLPPKIVTFHNPNNPYSDQDLTITASVEDISGLTSVEIYVDDVLVKACTQKVKISQCTYTSTHSAGVHSYYASATDTFGNSGSTDPKEFTILSE